MKKRTTGIKFKLLTVFLSVLILSTVITGFVTYHNVSNELYDVMERDSLSVVKEAKKTIGNYLNTYEVSLQQFARNENVTGFSSDLEETDVLVKDLKNYTQNTEGVAAIYFATPNKDVYMYPHADLDDAYDPTIRPWYSDAVKANGEVIWTDPYVTIDTNELVVSAAKAIRNGAELVGVIEIDLTLEELTNMVNEIEVGERGHIAVMDGNNTVIANLDGKWIGEALPIEEITEAVGNEEEGIEQFRIVEKNNEVEKFAAYSTIDNLNWVVMGMVECEEIDGESRAMLFDLIIVGLIALIIAAIVINFFANSITKPMKKLVKASNELILGHTDIDVDIKGKDEMGILGDAFRRIAENFKSRALIARDISKGNLDLDIELASEQDVLGMSMQDIIESLRSLVAESANLTEAAIKGDLKVRGNASEFEGGYKNIIDGVNDTLDAIVNPLDVALEFLADIANGEASESIDDVDKYQGYYGVLMGDLNDVFNSVLAMTIEVSQLTEEALKGNLKYRGDVSKLKGAYAAIVSEVNGTLDAVVEPISEATDVLEEMAKGNMKAKMEGNYKGDHSVIKEALNSMGGHIDGYITEISENLSEIANKDLTCGIEREYLGDFAKLKDSVNLIIGGLNVILLEIKESAQQVESAADQVASSSQILSQGSTEQASAIEEISASVTQVAEQTKENATNSNKANELSAKAKADAENGDKQMIEMIGAMNGIKESSANIAKIIKVIDDIAFQTNILALNAAVEAARAGEHGKGFAVVAEEVRNLAARSASAAKETTDMIDSSIKSVDEGYRMANETAGALVKIVGGTADAVEIVGMIAEASNEQADAVNEINSGVEQISQVTQSNTATAEESASASEEMAGQAQLLKGMIEEFKLKGAGTKKMISNARSLPKLQSPIDKELELEISLNDSNFGKY